MHPSDKSPFADVVSAFSLGREQGRKGAGSASAQTSGEELDLFRALAVLGEAPQQTMPFTQFAEQVPGDRIAALTSTVNLMRDGWVEFVGSISEKSDVRLTGRGREMLDTLRSAVAQS